MRRCPRSTVCRICVLYVCGCVCVRVGRLSEVTYTRDEVEELLTRLSGAVHDEVSAELVNADHTALLLLRQVFVQAQKWHLRLDSHVEQLEDK